MSERLARFVIVMVVVAWFATTVVLPVAIKGYIPPPEINTSMGIVAGGAAAYLFAKRSASGDSERRDDERDKTLEERALERARELRRATKPTKKRGDDGDSKT